MRGRCGRLQRMWKFTYDTWVPVTLMHKVVYFQPMQHLQVSAIFCQTPKTYSRFIVHGQLTNNQNHEYRICESGGATVFYFFAHFFHTSIQHTIYQFPWNLPKINYSMVKKTIHCASTSLFSSCGTANLLRIRVLRPWSLYEVLVEKYHCGLKEASTFSDFLLNMLDFLPDRRATAAQCLSHPWLISWALRVPLCYLTCRFSWLAGHSDH